MLDKKLIRQYMREITKATCKVYFEDNDKNAQLAATAWCQDRVRSLDYLLQVRRRRRKWLDARLANRVNKTILAMEVTPCKWPKGSYSLSKHSLCRRINRAFNCEFKPREVDFLIDGKRVDLYAFKTHQLTPCSTSKEIEDALAGKGGVYHQAVVNIKEELATFRFIVVKSLLTPRQFLKEKYG